jgi:nucleotide-binding universal stress UspA family protein
MNPAIAPAAPFTRVLVPLDGSPLAEAILPAAVRIAVACRARLTLFHVIEHNPPEHIHGQRHLADGPAATSYLRGVAARLALPQLDLDIHVHMDDVRDVATSIADHARELGADLVALTTHGSGGLRSVVVGSIAQQTLRRCAIPVLTIRPGGPPPTVDAPILVPLDGGAAAETALPVAVLLASRTTVPLHLVRVVRTVGTERGPSATVRVFTPTASAALLDIEADEAYAYLTGILARLPAGLASSFEVRRGDPADEIVRAAQNVRAGLLVATTHARVGVESIIAGSVIPGVLSHLAAPLLLIRRHVRNHGSWRTL